MTDPYSSFPHKQPIVIPAQATYRHSRASGNPLAFDGRKYDRSLFVIPAQAGIHLLFTVAKWIPAFAGMTLARG
jgi:hypothetical protein